MRKTLSTSAASNAGKVYISGLAGNETTPVQTENYSLGWAVDTDNVAVFAVLGADADMTGVWLSAAYTNVSGYVVSGSGTTAKADQIHDKIIEGDGAANSITGGADILNFAAGDSGGVANGLIALGTTIDIVHFFEFNQDKLRFTTTAKSVADDVGTDDTSSPAFIKDGVLLGGANYNALLADGRLQDIANYLLDGVLAQNKIAAFYDAVKKSSYIVAADGVAGISAGDVVVELAGVYVADLANGLGDILAS